MEGSLWEITFLLIQGLQGLPKAHSSNIEEVGEGILRVPKKYYLMTVAYYRLLMNKAPQEISSFLKTLFNHKT